MAFSGNSGNSDNKKLFYFLDFMKKYVLLAWMMLGIISAVDAAEQFVKFDKASAGNALLLMGTKDTIRYSPSDWRGGEDGCG